MVRGTVVTAIPAFSVRSSGATAEMCL
jgi:hypothetical protein